MWPTLLDMPKDECRKALRSLELEAYSSMVDVLRAQGHFNPEKKKLLSDAASAFNIPLERHKAEVRRAVNDERLNSIAEVLVGANTSAEWAIEGRRLIPLLPRPKLNTLFSVIADECADYVAAQRDIRVSETAQKAADFPFEAEPSSPEASKTHARSASPSGVLVFPSGAAVEMRHDDEEVDKKKRKQTQDNTPQSPQPKVQGIAQQPMTVSGRNMTPHMQQVTMPLKLSLNSAGLRTQTATQQHNFPAATKQQQVIIVSSQANTPSILQKQLSVPCTKPTPGKSTVMYTQTVPATPEGFKQRPKGMQSTPLAKPRASIVMGQKPQLKTVAGGAGTPKAGMPMQTKLVMQPAGKPQHRAIANAKPHHLVLHKPGKPVLTNVHMKSQAIANLPLQLRAATKPVQIKQDATTGVKMVSISTGGAKILPKPNPVFMVTSPSVTIASRTPTGAPTRVMAVTGGQPVKWTSTSGPGKPLPTMVVSQPRRQDGVVLLKSHTKNLIPLKESPPTKIATKVQKPMAGISNALAQSLQQLSSTSQTQSSPLILLDIVSQQQEKSSNVGLSEILQGMISSDADAKPSSVTDISNGDGQQEVKQQVVQHVTTMSIEEAVELLNKSDTPETRALLSQAGIQISDEIADSEEDEQSAGNSQPQVFKQEIKEEEPMNIVEEEEGCGEEAEEGTVAEAEVPVPPPSTMHTLSTRSRDIFGKALASADINLDSFMEEEEDEPEAAAAAKEESKMTDTKEEETDSAPDNSDPLELELGELTGVSNR